MEAWLVKIAGRFWPALKDKTGLDRAGATGDVFSLLYSLPFVAISLVWLVLVTDLTLTRATWLWLGFPFVFLYVMRRLEFYLFVEVWSGGYANFSGAFASILLWSAVLLFGPIVLWLDLFWEGVDLIRRWGHDDALDYRVNLVRNFTMQVASGTFPGLAALALYAHWGGAIPLVGLTAPAVGLALLGIFIRLMMGTVIWLPYLVYIGTAPSARLSGEPGKSFFRFTAVAMGWPFLVDPFAVLAAGLYVETGWLGYLFFITAVVLAAVLARQSSDAALQGQLRAREVSRLERLARAILTGPPDASMLGDLLQAHVPAMFPRCEIEIRLFPDTVLLHHPTGAGRVDEALWLYLAGQKEAQAFGKRDRLPWTEAPVSHTLLIAPILDVESAAGIGGICISRHLRVRHAEPIENLLPAVQALTSQIASALGSARAHERALALERVEQELAVAGEIQAGFLLSQLSEVLGWKVQGWQMAVALESARETSGDFYDVLPLSGGKFGILIADVADKGLGSALYMAVSRTLIRTYAGQYEDDPSSVFAAANPRIMKDTHADLFVTVFYAVLDPETGLLTYCNAGHNPPYLISARSGFHVQALRRTGIPLGIFEGESWVHRTLDIKPGQMLVLYTDGVIDAQDEDGDFFGEDRFLEILEARVECTAQDVQDAVMTAIRDFSGGAVQADDITLMVLKRDP